MDRQKEMKRLVLNGNKNYILRGCQLAEQRNLDICNKLDENRGVVEKKYCHKCNTDGCNSSPTTFNLNIVLVFVCFITSKISYNL
ncbi:hypothetical protein NQ314_013743 [Rhamnusium bicolor]|uniref:Uncharacterized protein n=1 Tax=Rhamnusium bicolor TaxID=1586634 RepID=A0AAV8X789_9CUCU|nr:hypothetical protein NQ314_013743 [Rhamnusium bicolor]